MFSSFRKRFGAPGMIAVIALVFAMAGGAWAAKGGVIIKKLSQISPSVQKQLKGNTGAPGPAGANGKDGTNGTNGTNGKDGTSVTTSAASGAECQSGGIKVLSASPPAKVCNGQTGFTETLPAGKTETGTWVVPTDIGAGFPTMPEGNAFVPISFPIPLTSAPAFVAVESGEDKSAEGCSGTVNGEGTLSGGEPVAASGKLCVYLSAGSTFAASITLGTISPIDGNLPAAGTSTSGTILKVSCANPAGCVSTKGTWAVTG
jgi:hypothetical protein